MELIKDIIKALIEGIIEYKAENKISEKRKEYFRHRKGKWQKICFIASIILALTLVTIGLCLIIQRKMIGMLLVCAGIGIGLSIAVDLVQTATFCGQQGRISRPVRAILSGRL